MVEHSYPPDSLWNPVAIPAHLAISQCIQSQNLSSYQRQRIEVRECHDSTAAAPPAGMATRIGLDNMIHLRHAGGSEKT